MLRIINKNIDAELKPILERTSFGMDRPEFKIVQKIVNAVQKSGDSAVLKYTRLYDSPKLKNLKVDPLEIDLAHRQLSKKVQTALRTAIKNISNFHLKQIPKSWLIPAGSESAVGLRYSPVSSAGIYVPGGRAVYPSSLLMNVIPAKIAGVERICVVTPPDKNGRVASIILAAAKELGISELYLCGGAQAIAALTFGTATIPRVDVIAGPGNIFVTLAKKMVYGLVGIDKLAGPSESLILADETANPAFVAADIIVQAEHDPQASSLLICNKQSIAEAVNKELTKQIAGRNRKEIIRKALKNYGACLVISKDSDYIRLADLIAPEHLQIMLKDAETVLNKVNNAGAIFVGNYSPQALGDYIAGPNHVLPTGGSARFASPLSVSDFIKKSSVINYSKKDLQAVREELTTLAELEGFDGHAAAVNIRF